MLRFRLGEEIRREMALRSARPTAPAATAAPRPKMNQVRAALLMGDLRRAIEAAAKAGHPPPRIRLDNVDGLSRKEAAEVIRWGLSLPGVAQAFGDNANPAHREIAGIRDLVQYFRFDHPTRADGSAKSWAETGAPPLSRAMQALILGERASVAPGDILPAEAAEIAAYGVARYDTSEAGGELGRQAAAEIAAYHTRAAQPGAPSGSGSTTEGEMDQTAAEARVKELQLALWGKMSAPDRGMVADELRDLYEAFPSMKPPRLTHAEIEATRGKYNNLVTNDFASAETIRLADELRGDTALGSRARQDKVAELQRTLEASPAGSKAAGVYGVRSGGPMILERQDFRSEASRTLSKELCEYRGSIAGRRALLDRLTESLGADQDAHDTAAAAAAGTEAA